MQAIGPRTSTAGTIYSASQILSFLTAPTLQHYFRWERWSPQGNYLGDLTPYSEHGKATISHDTSQSVSRTMALSVRFDSNLDILHDVVRAYYHITTPDGASIPIALGRFIVTNVKRRTSKTHTWFDIQGADFSQYLNDSAYSINYSVPANSTLWSALSNILRLSNFPADPDTGTTTLDMVDPGLVLGQSLSLNSSVQITNSGMPFNSGTTYLSAISSLCTAFGYNFLWIDENGNPHTEPVPDFNYVKSCYTFDATSATANIVADVEFEVNPDISNTFNQFIVSGNDPKGTAFSIFYQNNNPDSPISVVNWRPKMAAQFQTSGFANATSAYNMARNYAQNYSRVNLPYVVRTLPWPFSQNLDIYDLIYQTPQEGSVQLTLQETKWEMDCSTGGLTTHTFQLVTPL